MRHAAYLQLVSRQSGNGPGYCVLSPLGGALAGFQVPFAPASPAHHGRVGCSGRFGISQPNDVRTNRSDSSTI